MVAAELATQIVGELKAYLPQTTTKSVSVVVNEVEK